MVAIVVQPGVEFGHEDVAVYRPEAAASLVAARASLPGLVYEAHSTDYQPEASLARLVADGLKTILAPARPSARQPSGKCRS